MILLFLHACIPTIIIVDVTQELRYSVDVVESGGSPKRSLSSLVSDFRNSIGISMLDFIGSASRFPTSRTGTEEIEAEADVDWSTIKSL